MPDRLLRTFAATAILVAVAISGFLQLTSPSEQSPVEIVDQAVEPTSDQLVAQDIPTTSEAESDPFVYKVGLLDGISTENFWKYFGSAPTVWDAYVLGPTKASLFRIDATTLELVPEVAASFSTPTWNRDGWRVMVALRDDMSWSDGVRLSASDISFTFRTVRALQLGGQWADVFPASVIDVIARDDRHLEIRFSSRPSLATWPYGVGTAPIMASHIWGLELGSITTKEELFDLGGETDVAGGPIQIVQVGESSILARSNPGYPDSRSAPVVEYVVFDSEADSLVGLKDGTVHLLASPNGLKPDQVASLETEPDVALVNNPKFGVRYLSFNTDREPMDKVAFRRAVAFLINPENLTSDVASNSPAYTMLPKAATAWFDDGAAAQIESNRGSGSEAELAAVVAALKEDGYQWQVEPSVVDGVIVPGDGLEIGGRTPAPLTILTSGDSYDPRRRDYTERIAQSIETLGFKVIPVSTDFGSVIDLTFTPDENGQIHYDMALLGWSLGNPSLPGFYGDLFGTSGVANNTGYSSPTMDSLIKSLDSSTDIESARETIWRIESLIAVDLPYIPLYSSQITEAFRSDLVSFPDGQILGGIQAALGGIELVTPKN
jgi:peptide/nickel transport system substrate-binding protein